MYWEDRQYVGMYYEDIIRLELFGVDSLCQAELGAPEAFPPGSMSQFQDFECDEDGEILSITYYADWYGVWRE